MALGYGLREAGDPKVAGTVAPNRVSIQGTRVIPFPGPRKHPGRAVCSPPASVPNLLDKSAALSVARAAFSLP